MPTMYYEVDDVAINTFYTGRTISPGSPMRRDRGQAVLFVHGAGGNGHAWVDILEGLAAEHSPIAIDLPAHGQSGGSAALESVDAYCEVVDRFVEVAQFTPFVFVGHSMGGAIAQAYALKHPDKLSGLVLSSTGARLRVAQATLDLWRDASLGRNVDTRSRAAYSDKTPIDIVRKGWAEQDKTRASVRLSDYLVCDRFDRMQSIGDIAVPTLVLGGTDDVVTPPKYAQYLQAHISGAVLRMIPDAGHASYFEQPDAMIQALSDFLGRL
jgi:pimeloyl-ACP methyl ester carboxylesterase